MVDHEAATIVVRNSRTGKFLLMKRAESKEMMPGRWEFPGGGIDEGETPEEAALREFEEETGLKEEISFSGESAVIDTKHGRIRIFPFLVETTAEEIVLSREHTEYRWIKKEDLEDFETVKGLEKELEAVGL
jgi:8-oxo-dGTP diphosphatase